MNAEQHAVWITDQLSKWHRQSLLVRDREMQLFETNKQLRELTPKSSTSPRTAGGSRTRPWPSASNSRQLSGLVASGEDLIKQAMRNPEFGIAHLEKWAEMLGILKDIAGSRMPSVADLLREAAQAPSSKSQTSPNNNKSMMAGNVRAGEQGRSIRAEAGRQAQAPFGNSLDRGSGIVAAAAR